MKAKRLLVALLSIVMVFSVFATGCGKNQTNTKGATNNTQKDSEQYLNFFGAEPNTLDPGIASIDTAWVAQSPIYEGLTRITVDEKGNHKIEPGVAETWEANEAGTEFTFHLRKNAKWSDGTPVTANDFVYSLRRVVDPKTGSKYNTFFNPFIVNASEIVKGEKKPEDLGVEAVDDNTLKIYLVKPTPYFIQLSYFPTLKPVKKEAVEKYGDKYGSEAEQIVGNGPYILKEWVHNGHLAFEKNPNYWDKDNVFVEKMTWKIVDDKNSRMNALFAGEVDSGGVTDADWKAKFDATGDYNFISIKDAGCDYLMFNQNDKYFKNLKIRRAFSAVLDRDSYVKAVDKGVSIPAYEYIPDTISIGNDNFRQKVGDPKFIRKMQQEIGDAKAYLVEGLKEEGLDPDPAKMEITISLRGTNDYVKRQADWLIEEYKNKLGVTVKCDMMQYQVFYQKIDAGEFQLGNAGWVADYNDPSTFIDFHHSETGYYPKAGLVNKELDEIIAKAGSITDNDERAKLYIRAEEILLYENCAFIPLTHGKGSTYRRKYVQGMMSPTFGYFDYKGVYTQGRK